MWVPEEPKLTVAQPKTVVDICVGVGNVAAGSVLIPALVDRWSFFFVVFGSLGALFFWLIAIKVSRKI